MKKDKKADKLYKQFQDILKKEGDGEKMKNFLDKNISKFNKEFQNRIIYSLFSKSLKKMSTKKRYSKDGLEAIKMINNLDKFEKQVKEKINILDIKSSIIKDN